jgi:hypothetical protein
VRTWLSRYREEPPAAVYRELAALGAEVRHPRVLPDALSVAREAAARVRRNVGRLSERWGALGFRFGYHWAGAWAEEEVRRAPPHLGQPNAEDMVALDRFESEVGPLSLSLRAFYEVVGAVNFVGAPEGEGRSPWPDRELLDPLQVDAFTPQLDYLLQADEGEEDRQVHICPDEHHKFFISGCSSLMAPVPCPEMDVVLTFERDSVYWDGEPLYFMDYLRETILRRGGVGLVEEPPGTLREALVRDLLPF